MRAAAEDGETAALMGIRLRPGVGHWPGWSAGALAAVAAVFLGRLPDPGLSRAAYTVALRAFPAAILGGLDSTGGALVGGLLDRRRRVAGRRLPGPAAFLGRGFGDVVPYVVMLIVLLVRPVGLFGTKELTRV